MLLVMLLVVRLRLLLLRRALLIMLPLQWLDLFPLTITTLLFLKRALFLT